MNNENITFWPKICLNNEEYKCIKFERKLRLA